MIHFPDIRARRFTIRMRELSIGQAYELAARPAHLEQANTSAFLRFAVVDPEIEPERWRVGERLLAVAHYLACVTGEADFSVGPGRYSDYLVPETETVPDQIELGTVVGDPWKIRHLDGRLAEAIERIDLDGMTGRWLWLVGMMAAQLFRHGEAEPSDMTDGELDEWLAARVTSFLELPESEFEAMMLAFTEGRETLAHLFRIDADESGLICRPTQEAAGLPPAKFPFRAGLSQCARAMARPAQ